MKKTKNQSGYMDIIILAILGGIVGSLFIVGVFIWDEITFYAEYNSPKNIIAREAKFDKQMDRIKELVDPDKISQIIQPKKPEVGDIIFGISLKIKAPFSTAILEINPEEYDIFYTAWIDSEDEDIIRDSKYISSTDFENLTKLIQENNFWELDDEYIDNTWMDADYYTVSAMTCGDHICGPTEDPQAKSVVCYGECPRELDNIIDEIERLWGRDILKIGV